MIWLMIDNHTGLDAPRWVRSIAVADDGTVYAPAAMTNDEDGAFARVFFDGEIKMIFDEDHLYLPTRWIAGAYPEVADLCESIEAKVRDWHARN